MTQVGEKHPTWLEPGLYRAQEAVSDGDVAIPRESLVYLGVDEDAALFATRPNRNENNLWYWSSPTIRDPDPDWLSTLQALPPEGFYSLPEAVQLESGGTWPASSLLQLGYTLDARALGFVAERRGDLMANALFFGRTGQPLSDELLYRLRPVWVSRISDA